MEEYKSPESSKPSKEEVISTLQTLGTEDSKSKELLVNFIEQRKVELQPSIESHLLDFELSIEKSKLLYEAGLLVDALEELTINGEVAWDKDEMGIYDRMCELALEIEAKL